MGCDIHVFREKKVGGTWVTADTWEDEDPRYEDRFTDRNYDLFGVLASVRKDTSVAMTPRGVPVDASNEVLTSVGNWGSDGHSHSFIHLHELKMLVAYIETGKFQLLIGEEKPVSMALLRDGSMEDPKPITTVLTGPITTTVSGKMLSSQWEALKASEPKDWDLLYPHCGGTTNPNYVDFRVDVPLSYLVSEPLKRMIGMLESLDGEDQRFVFFFDN